MNTIENMYKNKVLLNFKFISSKLYREIKKNIDLKLNITINKR